MLGSGKTVHTPLKRVAQSVPLANPDTASVTSSDGRLAYLLLGQEEYKEHHSEITQCKFSGTGCVIGESKSTKLFNTFMDRYSLFDIKIESLNAGPS